MKHFLSPLLIPLLLLASPVVAHADHFDRIQTNRGRVFSNCQVLGHDAYGLNIRHSRGAARLAFSDLSNSMRTRYNYSAAAAKQFVKKHTKPRQKAASRQVVRLVPQQRSVRQQQIVYRNNGGNGYARQRHSGQNYSNGFLASYGNQSPYLNQGHRGGYHPYANVGRLSSFPCGIHPRFVTPQWYNRTARPRPVAGSPIAPALVASPGLRGAQVQPCQTSGHRGAARCNFSTGFRGSIAPGVGVSGRGRTQ